MKALSIATASVILAALAPRTGHAQPDTGGTALCQFPPRSATAPPTRLERILEPPPGTLYHGVFVGGAGGMEDDVTPATLRSYETHVCRRVAWVYFSQNWYKGTAFPVEQARWIYAAGSIPYLRLMFRDSVEWTGRIRTPPRFPLRSIGVDASERALRAWAAQAASLRFPLLVEFGTEANGYWFPWNSRYNRPDGATEFRHAFARVVAISREMGAHNITWVFHAAADDDPATEGNRIEDYYPGSEWVDWVAVSVYGAQKRGDAWDPFLPQLSRAIQRLERCAPGKPIVVAELGGHGHEPAEQTRWADDALQTLLSGAWKRHLPAGMEPRVIGFAWWNSPPWQLNMQVETNTGLADVLRRHLASPTVLDQARVADAFPRQIPVDARFGCDR